MATENIDVLINEINQDIEKMNSNKDIKKNVLRYNLNKQKITTCLELINNMKESIFNSSDDENSEELIDDAQYLKYLDELDGLKKIDFQNLKLNDATEKYQKYLFKIRKCKEYLENQNIEITNLD